MQTALRRHADPRRRAFVQAGYAASRMRVLGAAVPHVRAAARAAHRALRRRPARDVIRVARLLIDDGTMEGRQAGYELLSSRDDVIALLTPAQIRRLGRGNDNWASVDAFATLVAGRVWLAGRVPDREVLAWAESRNRWWRRTALVSTVVLNVRARGGRGDAARTLAVCRRFASETDPMLAKALSWALRALVPHAPADVRAFLGRHRRRLPAVVVREVTAKLETGRKHG